MGIVRVAHGVLLLMVIHDFNVAGMLALKTKNDPPLTVDPNAPKSGAIAAQHFQPVARRHRHFIRADRRAKGLQLSNGSLGKSRRKSLKSVSRQPKMLCCLVIEALDHVSVVMFIVTNVHCFFSFPLAPPPPTR